MSVLATTPVLVPLLTAGLTTLTAGRGRLQQALSALGALAFLSCALVLTLRAAAGETGQVSFGNWPAPYGIKFELDRLSSMLVLVTALMGAAALLFMASDADAEPRHPLSVPLLHGTLAGVAGAFSTADLFNLYVWFEVMLICALGQLAAEGRREQLDAAFKYLCLNLFGALLLLAAVGLVYAATGHLNFDALARSWGGVDPGLRTALLAALGIALLLKSAAFPLYAWLPASYPALPAPVLALFAGLLTKVGVYAVLRVFGDVFAPSPAMLAEALGWIAAATMIAGVLGAAYHWDMRRILAFHIVSQIGYILLAIALGMLGTLDNPGQGRAGHAAALFYTVHHIVVKANLFLIACMAAAMAGSYDLRRIGGLAAARPALALVFAVPALSLVGVPPLSGFWAKMLVLQEALAQGRVVWTVLGLAVSVLTLYSMMKVWMEAFWKPAPKPGDGPQEAATDLHMDGNGHQQPAALRLGPAWWAVGMLATLTLAIGLAPQVLIGYVQAAAATLGGRP